MSAAKPILIVGASTRAAAQSAYRAGYSPICADRFADRDLFDVAQVISLDRYPTDIPTSIATSAAPSWMYTGALENDPEMIDQVCCHSQLLGNSAEVVRRVRNPFRIQETLRQLGYPTLRVVKSATSLTRNATWVKKPLPSAGGFRITICNQQDDRETNTEGEPVYFQEFVAGDSLSALFLADRNQTVFLGATEQRIGLNGDESTRFVYRGSVFPARCPETAVRQMARIGTALGRGFQLQGLFGCDFVFDGKTAWLIEVNPRYPASAETIEYGRGIPLVDWHVQACRQSGARPSATTNFVSQTSAGVSDHQDRIHDESPTEYDDQRSRQNVPKDFTSQVAAALAVEPHECVMKEILFAAEDVVVPKWNGGDWKWHLDTAPTIADIPQPGQIIRRNEPICTIMANGADYEMCERLLVERRRQITDWLSISGYS